MKLNQNSVDPQKLREFYIRSLSDSSNPTQKARELADNLFALDLTVYSNDYTLDSIIYSAFAMFLSQVLNNRSAATAIMVIGLFLSMINVPEAFGLLSKVWSYLPGAYIGSWTFTEYRLIHIFGKFFNNLQMAPVFWMIVSMIFIAIAGCSYKQYQVKGK